VPKGKTETEVKAECVQAATLCGALIWRNNVGVFTTRHGEHIRAGLCVGSADLIGITKDGKFLAIECKKEIGGIVSKEQTAWLETITEKGGVAIVATCAEDVIRVLRGL